MNYDYIGGNEYDFNGYDTILINDNDTLDDELKKLLNCVDKDYYMIIGVDTEWKSGPNTKKGMISLIQISYMDTILLIRLLMNNVWENELLKKVLKHDNILKFGIGLYNDKIRLYNDFGLILNNIFDLVTVFWKVFDRIPLINKLEALNYVCYYGFIRKRLKNKKYIRIENRHNDISLTEMYVYLFSNNYYSNPLSWKNGDHNHWEDIPLQYDFIEYAAYDGIKTIKCIQELIKFMNGYDYMYPNYLSKYLFEKDIQIYSSLNIPVLRSYPKIKKTDKYYGLLNKYDFLKKFVKYGDIISMYDGNKWLNACVLTHHDKLKQSRVITETGQTRFISPHGYIILATGIYQ